MKYRRTGNTEIMAFKNNNSLMGRIALIMTTLIWGTSFVVLKTTISSIPTLYVLAFRFTGAALIMLILGARHLKKIDKSYLLGGGLMGVMLFIAYTVQTFGLSLTTPGKNAFLTTTYCVLVPFLYWFVSKKKPDAYNISAALICVAGVGFVSLQRDLSVNLGDLLTLFCGLFFALHIIITDKVVVGKSVLALTLVQFTVAAALAWIFGFMTAPFPTKISGDMLWRIGYLSIMCTAVCYVLQTYGQKHTSPSATAVIMTLESVFGAIISVIFYHEELSAKLLIGFALIFAAVLISETKLNFLKRRLD